MARCFACKTHFYVTALFLMQHLKTYGQQYEDKDKVIKLSTTCARRSQQGLGKYVIPLGSLGARGLCLLVVLIKRSHVSTKTLKMGHTDARGGCKGTRREAVEKGFVDLPPLCTLYFALCTSKKVSPLCCHFAPTPFKARCCATPL